VRLRFCLDRGVDGISFTVHPFRNFSIFFLPAQIISGSEMSCDTESLYPLFTCFLSRFLRTYIPVKSRFLLSRGGRYFVHRPPLAAISPFPPSRYRSLRTAKFCVMLTTLVPRSHDFFHDLCASVPLSNQDFLGRRLVLRPPLTSAMDCSSQVEAIVLSWSQTLEITLATLSRDLIS